MQSPLLALLDSWDRLLLGKYWIPGDGLCRTVSAFSTSTGLCSCPLRCTTTHTALIVTMPQRGEREWQVEGFNN